MVGRKLLWGIAALVLLAAVAAAAYWTAVGSPSVLEPGARSSAHEGVDCLRCHSSYEGVSDGLCLDCHEDAVNWTWHTASGGGADCDECHYEHVGRDRITDLTAVPACPRGEKLAESHEGLRCVECHRNGEPTEVCADCHARYQGGTHLVGYTDACDICHDQVDWVTTYDHESPDNPDRQCADCHGGEPPHSLPAYREWTGDCDVCHGTVSWTIPDFPHEAIRDSCAECHPVSLDPAWGGSSAECSDCHTIFSWTPASVVHGALDGSCLRCHGEDPPPQHLTRAELGYVDCNMCHGDASWSRTVVHEDYAAPCVQCHVEDEAAHEGPFAADCQWCHGTDAWAVATPHPSQGSACLECHIDPHLGGDADAHVDAAHTALCADCHVAGLNWTVIVVDHVPLGSDCVACHATPHLPYGAIAVACGACHGTVSWVPLVVDHDLLGLDCASCHATPHPNAWDQWSDQCTLCHAVDDWNTRSFDHDISNATSVMCVKCHDDVHRGTLGILCEECHTVDTWETEVINP